MDMHKKKKKWMDGWKGPTDDQKPSAHLVVIRTEFRNGEQKQENKEREKRLAEALIGPQLLSHRDASSDSSQLPTTVAYS